MFLKDRERERGERSIITGKTKAPGDGSRQRWEESEDQQGQVCRKLRVSPCIKGINLERWWGLDKEGAQARETLQEFWGDINSLGLSRGENLKYKILELGTKMLTEMRAVVKMAGFAAVTS